MTGINHQLRVYENITQLIPNPDNPTPLVKINKLNHSETFQLYLKLERYNPFGSIKDRIAFEMLNGLQVNDEQTIIEPSSGNTGIGLVCIANARGIPIEIAVPDKIPEEKKAILKFLGAKVLEADDQLCPLFPSEGARGLVKALLDSPDTKDTYVSPNQYENLLNVQAHYKTTGPEIWKQTQGKINYFFAGLGTCGTITGVGKFLKEQNPEVKIIAVEPSSQNHKLPGLKRITGLPEDLVPKILDKTIIDDIVSVGDEEAYATTFQLAKHEGIPVGPTTGAIVYAALQYGKERQGLAVVISPDDAFKYTSFFKRYFEKESQQPSQKEYDLSGLLCPASKIEASRILDNLERKANVRLIIGNVDSLKSIIKDIKSRGLKTSFQKEGDDRFVLTVSETMSSNQ